MPNERDPQRRRIDKVIDAVQVKMQETGETIADVARYLKKGYTQTYDWIRLRQGIPNGETTLALAEYAGLIPEQKPSKPKRAKS